MMPNANYLPVRNIVTSIFILFLLLSLFYSRTDENAPQDDKKQQITVVNENIQKQRIKDVIIVGGGVAGMYANYMLTKHTNFNVQLIEKLDRVGGRTFTTFATYRDATIHLENGGMRFLDEHTQVNKLLTELSLCDEKEHFLQGTGGPGNIYYLRRRRFTQKLALKNPKIWSTIYRLKSNERNLQPLNLTLNAFNRVLDENPRKSRLIRTPKQWQDFRLRYTFSGRPMKNWGYWALLRAQGYSTEAVSLMKATIGFTSYFHQEVNAGDVFQQFIPDWTYNAHSPYYTLRSGYDSLAKKMNQIVSEQGHAPLFNRNVTGIVSIKSNQKKMYVVDTTNTVDGSHERFYAKTVILAIPTQSLQQLLPRVPDLYTPQIRGLVDSIIPQHLTKINLLYDTAWWKRLHLNGGSFTDNEIGSLYVAPAWTNGSFTAVSIYCDELHANYWQQLQLMEGDYPIVPGILLRGGRQYIATRSVVSAAQELIHEMVGFLPRPPLAAFYAPWGLNTSYGAADHKWGINVDDRVVLDRIWQPSKSEDIFIANSAYSLVHDWVEGAILATNEVLFRRWGLNGLGNVETCPPLRRKRSCVYGRSADLMSCNFESLAK